MFEVAFHQVMKYMGTNLILQDVSFNLYQGERVGIVGSNGSGKTTILKLIAGILPLKRYPGSWSKGYDNGMVAVPKDARVAYLDQIPDYPESTTAREILMSAFDEAMGLEKRLRALELEMASAAGVDSGAALDALMAKYHKAQLAFELAGGYEIEEKVSKVCMGLSLDEAFLDKTFSQLSGGEKTRLMLGKILMDRPDILLLDEPTNHLDTHAIEWLEQYLATYQGIVVVVSHDRYFLDQAVNKIVEIENQTVQVFKGNYSAYMRQKEEQVRLLLEQYKEQQKQIKQMESAIKQLRDWAMRSDNNKFFQRAASIQTKLDKMDRIRRPKAERSAMRLDLSFDQRSGREALRVAALEMAFGDQVLFRGAEALIHYGERVALVGPNGSGKSTLFRMMLGELVPDSGVARLGGSVRLGYLPQEVFFEVESDTVLECFKRQVIMTEGQARSYLAQFMFLGSRVFTQVSRLSGGERIRLKLAMMLSEDVNLLLLDEPTNHLDIESIEALEAALDAYQGTLCFISHDRYFINEVAERILSIENLGLVSYEGNYDAYREAVAAKARRIAEQQALMAAQQIAAKSVFATKSATTPKSDIQGPRDFEAEIAALEATLEALSHALLSVGEDYQQLSHLKAQHLSYQEALTATWRDWETAQAQD